MNFNAKQIPAPKYWQQFEDLCLALFRRVWNDPDATKNGRVGQAQHGTDVSGRPRDAKGPHGVQCKGKDVALGAEVTKEEFDAEVAKAEKFTPMLEHWTLATTSPKDARMEEHARVVSAAREQLGKFRVNILFWEDLQSLIAEYPEIIEQFYPDQSPRMIRLMQRLEGAATPDAMASAHAQATEEIAHFINQNPARNPIYLTIERVAGEESMPSSHEEVAKSLLAGDAIIIEAEPGAGKTTSLLQVATKLAELSKDSTPLIVPLAEQLDAKQDLATQIFGRARLRPIGADTLNGLALGGHFTFLCDGWNERSAEERAWLQREFGKLRRDYDQCGLLVTTRQLSPLSVPDAKKFIIRPLSFDQQLELLRQHDPESAETLLIAARRLPGLRGVIRNPLYLNALAVIAPRGQLPETKESVLHEFVHAHDENTKHRDELYKVFQGNHGEYLRRLASAMAVEGTSSLKESRAVTLVAETSEQLQNLKRIEAKSKPGTAEALEALVAHHLLVVLHTEKGERVFGFQHQQILEWYASLWLEQSILEAYSNGNEQAGKAVVRYCDRSDSGEVLLFAVERLGHGNKASLEALAALVLLVFDLDIMLCAEMIRRSPATVWELLAREISTRVDALAKTNLTNAVLFMGRCGRPEFAGRLWDAIKDKERYDGFANVARGWLLPGSLGPEGIKRVLGLDPELIRAIVWDFCVYAGEEGIEFSTTIALRADLSEVALTVLDHLEFEGADDAANRFIEAMPEKLWKSVATALPIRRARSNIRDRIIKYKVAHAATLEGTDKFHALRELSAAGIHVDRNAIIDLALGADFKDYSQQQYAIKFVSEAYPAEFQAACIAKLKAGQELPPYADDYIRPEPAEEGALVVMLQRGTKTSRRNSHLAKTFTRTSVSRLFDELDAVTANLEQAREKDEQGLYQERSALVDVICSATAEEVVEAILTRRVTSPAQVNGLSEVLFRLKTASRDEDALAINASIRERLIKTLAGWARFFEEPGKTRRHYASNYATALGKVPHPDLLPPLITALRYELHECEIDRAERAGWKTTGKKPHLDRDRCGYWMIYRSAIGKFDGDETKRMLVPLLDSPDFGEAAVFELVRFASSKPRGERFHGPSFNQIKIMRNRDPGKCDPIAAEVMKQIGRLTATGNPEDAAMAVNYATAAVQIDFGPDAGPIFSAAEKAPSADGRYNLLTAMLVFGLEVPSDWIAAGYESAYKRYFDGNWQNRQEWWSVRRWLELLGASDDPERVLVYIEELPKEYKCVMNLREVASAMGHSPSKKATSALIRLAKAIPEFIPDHDFQNALLRQNDEKGARYLLELLMSDTGNIFRGVSGFHAAKVIAAMFTQHSHVKADFLQKLRARDVRVTPLVARVAHECIESNDIPDLIENVSSSDGPLADALVGAVGGLAIRREPIEGSESIYQETAVELTALRKRLFALAHDRGPRAKLACRILSAIEAQREHYGRPPCEPRHPDYESGRQWPMEEPQDD
jgi:hypothetical protein